MINVIFWGIVALLIMICRADDDAGKFFLLFGICIVLAIYGVYTGSTALMVIFGIPTALLALAAIVLFFAWAFKD